LASQDETVQSHEGQSTAVNSADEIPEFADEDEERDFWETHHVGPGMLNGFTRVGAHPAVVARPKTITIRIVPDILRRLQNLAARKGIRYQTLVKAFVTERLYEEEKREGIVGG